MRYTFVLFLLFGLTHESDYVKEADEQMRQFEKSMDRIGHYLNAVDEELKMVRMQMEGCARALDTLEPGSDEYIEVMEQLKSNAISGWQRENDALDSVETELSRAHSNLLGVLISLEKMGVVDGPGSVDSTTLAMDSAIARSEENIDQLKMAPPGVLVMTVLDKLNETTRKLHQIRQMYEDYLKGGDVSLSDLYINVYSLLHDIDAQRDLIRYYISINRRDMDFVRYSHAIYKIDILVLRSVNKAKQILQILSDDPVKGFQQKCDRNRRIIQIIHKGWEKARERLRKKLRRAKRDTVWQTTRRGD